MRYMQTQVNWDLDKAIELLSTGLKFTEYDADEIRAEDICARNSVGGGASSSSSVKTVSIGDEIGCTVTDDSKTRKYEVAISFGENFEQSNSTIKTIIDVPYQIKTETVFDVQSFTDSKSDEQKKCGKVNKGKGASKKEQRKLKKILRRATAGSIVTNNNFDSVSSGASSEEGAFLCSGFQAIEL